MVLPKSRKFIVLKSFNINLVQFILWYHVIFSDVNICSFICIISHVHRCAPKTVLHTQNTKSLAQKVIIYEGLIHLTEKVYFITFLFVD